MLPSLLSSLCLSIRGEPITGSVIGSAPIIALSEFIGIGTFLAYSTNNDQ